MKGTPRSLEHDWRSAKQLARLAQRVARDERLDMVRLYSFGCGYDAVSLEEVRLVLEAAGKPLTALKTDEMVDVSHIRIRLRTLAGRPRATFGTTCRRASALHRKKAGKAASTQARAASLNRMRKTLPLLRKRYPFPRAPKTCRRAGSGSWVTRCAASTRLLATTCRTC